MERLLVDTFIKSQSPQLGQSRPLLVQASNGEKYFLKNNMVRFPDGNWQDENCAFFNEVISSKLADYLGIATPKIAILEIEEDMMHANSDLLFQRRIGPGNYFGTKLIDSVEDNLLDNYSELRRLGKPHIRRAWNQYFKNIDNSESIASIIVLDLLVGNFDRFDNTGNLIISNTDESRKIFAIDHGHCFKGPFYDLNKENFLQSNKFNNQDEINKYIDSIIWTIISVAQYNQNGKIHNRPFNLAGEIFKSIEQYVDLSDLNNHSFMDPIAKLESLDSIKLSEMLSVIPDEWTLGLQKQKTLYIEYILRQIQIMQLIIQRLVNFNAFSNYRGGVLNWKTENLTGTQ